jgi:hypothetical protein
MVTEDQKRRNFEQRILAHRQLAETYVTNPEFISEAILHLETVINIAKDKEDSKQQQAEAFHKLGLLFNMEGRDKNPKKSL